MKRVVLVGLGPFGRQHLRILVELGVPLALVDTDPGALSAARDLVPSPDTLATTDLAAVLRSAEAAIVAVPSDQHRAVASACLAAGLPVLCEKPLAPTGADAVALAELADTRGGLLQTGFVLRHHPATRIVLDWIAGGAVGAVRAVTARVSAFKRPRTDGGCAINDGIHFIDLGEVMHGRPARAAFGVTADLLGTGREDLAYLGFDHGPGLTHVEASYHGPERVRRLTVLGEAGAIVADYDASSAQATLYAQAHETRDGRIVAEPRAAPVTVTAPNEPALRVELVDFLRRAREGTRPTADGWAGARAVVALEAALTAARERRWVEIPRVGPG